MHPHPFDIDKIISVEISNQKQDPHLYKIVEAMMIHGPCGVLNRRSPCMLKGKCTW